LVTSCLFSQAQGPLGLLLQQQQASFYLFFQSETIGTTHNIFSNKHTQMDDIPIFATELEHKNFTEPHGNYKGGGVIAPET
jgi:hypothetical protein